MELVGRKKEITLFRKIKESHKSEFVAVYGRRRVGKTFLIRNVYKDEFCFQLTGLANASLPEQLMNFRFALQAVDQNLLQNKVDDWLTAFQLLMNYLGHCKQKRKIIFIDELPWFDTPKSGFVQALEHFWNSWASARNDIILVVCGSATSWMLNKLINNKGGLHNRVTRRIKLSPFTLRECELLLRTRNINLDRYQILQLYMAMGGIPFYWDALEKGKSAMQNIQEICFSENGLLRGEFNILYHSLFKNAENHLKIIKALSKKTKGLTRQEIIEESGLPNAGSTTRILLELEESGFVRKYHPYNKKTRESLIQLTDFYSLFYMKFVEDSDIEDQNYWINMNNSAVHRAWSGYAFEQVCLMHANEIKKALGISGVQTGISSWRSSERNFNTQIDLVIDRDDWVINLCECKYSIDTYTITKKYEAELRQKINRFIIETKTRKSVFLTMITTFGVPKNEYATGIIQNEVVMDDLFV